MKIIIYKFAGENDHIGATGIYTQIINWHIQNMYIIITHYMQNSVYYIITKLASFSFLINAQNENKKKNISVEQQTNARNPLTC